VILSVIGIDQVDYQGSRVRELRELCLMRQKLTCDTRHGHVTLRRIVLAWSLVHRSPSKMEQHPKLTLDWALRCLERALGDLEDGPAERRVRRQFHQLLLAIEREAGEVPSLDSLFPEPLRSEYPEPARVR
jgi:hypothetical protein